MSFVSRRIESGVLTYDREGGEAMGQLSRAQWVTLLATVANLALVLLFPPHDYLSLQRGNVATFAGFFWAFGEYPHHVLNSNFLALEVIVILINAAIAWMLLRSKAKTAQKTLRYQRGVLLMVGFNLTLMLVFPPFENYTAVTKAMLPSFEGFYFVFGDNSQRQMVTTILSIEITLLLINAGLLLLFLKDRRKAQLSPEQIRALAQKLRSRQR